jgi:hypothetical protein
MKPEDIAAALAQGFGTQNSNGNSDIGIHTGTIVSWDEVTGLNSVLINGNTFNNLPVLSTSNSIMLSPGDVVQVERKQSQYFILGRVQAPGAGAALNWRSARINTQESTTSTTYTDLTTVGPSVSNVYIGSSRRCIVLTTGRIGVSGNGGYFSFAVSGASTIAPDDSRAAFTFGTQQVTLANTNVTLLTAADGLNPGFHTFTMKYRFDSGTVFGGPPGTGPALFLIRTITVMPF